MIKLPWDHFHQKVSPVEVDCLPYHHALVFHSPVLQDILGHSQLSEGNADCSLSHQLNYYLAFHLHCDKLLVWYITSEQLTCDTCFSHAAEMPRSIFPVTEASTQL